MSQLTKLKKRNQEKDATLCQLMGINQDRLSELVFEEALMWIEARYTRTIMITSLSYSNEFWSWWKMTWHAHDRQLLADRNKHSTKDELDLDTYLYCKRDELNHMSPDFEIIENAIKNYNAQHINR